MVSLYLLLFSRSNVASIEHVIDTALTADPAAAPVAVLGAVAEALSGLAASIDAAQMTPAEASSVVERLGRIQRWSASLLLLAAPALPDDTHLARTPHRTTARWLASTCGTSVRDATATLAAGGALPSLPATEAAVRAGSLSTAQAQAVTEAAMADPTAEARLLDAAATRSLHGLRSFANQVKAAAGGDDAARDRRARAQRHLRCRIGAGGAFEGDLSGPADEGVIITRALRHYAEEAFRDARASGDRPPFEALQWDALVAMARAALGERSPATVGGAATKVIVRVDHEALVRGHTEPGETCDIAGLGPVPVTAVRRLLADPDSFLAVVLTRAERIVSAVHLGRRPTALQRTVLEWLHPTCAVDDCDSTILQWDHSLDWVFTHHTTLEELDGLCGPHHRLKTDHNWRLVPGTGKRPLRPPGHPEHPGHPAPPRRRRRTRSTPAPRTDTDGPPRPSGV
jgi:hypothetical protein